MSPALRRFLASSGTCALLTGAGIWWLGFGVDDYTKLLGFCAFMACITYGFFAIGQAIFPER